MPQPVSAQLLVYTFGPDADFEGRMVDALGRIEIGGSIRVLDALFVRRDADTGELAAVVTHGDELGSLAAPLIGFRLDPAERAKATEAALAGREAGASGAAVRQLADGLEPGHAVAAVLVDHVWARTLERGVTVTGGTLVANEMVAKATLSGLAADRLA